MFTEEQLPCRHRPTGQTPRDSIFYKCDIHGQCSLDREHPRIRPCVLCEDRSGENGVSPENPHKYLGDRVESALKIVGVTKERITEWLGFDCNCEENRDRLNMLDRWARRVISGKIDQAKELLEKIME